MTRKSFFSGRYDAGRAFVLQAHSLIPPGALDDKMLFYSRADFLYLLLTDLLIFLGNALTYGWNVDLDGVLKGSSGVSFWIPDWLTQKSGAVPRK